MPYVGRLQTKYSDTFVRKFKIWLQASRVFNNKDFFLEMELEICNLLVWAAHLGLI